MNLQESNNSGLSPYEQAEQNNKAAEEQKQEPAKAAEESKAIYLGNKKFNSVEELAAYTSQLERDRSAPVEQPVVQKSKKISELIFEDPDKALELHEQQIIQKLKAQEQAKNAEKQYWDDFYTKNKDLNEDKDLVEFALGKHWNELKTLHPDQAMQKLAEYTRNTVVRFRKTETQKQEMPAGQAKAGLGTSYAAPQIPEKKAAPVDFVSQLKKIQTKRK